MRTTWTFHTASQIVFGAGAAGQTGALAARLGARRVLIVSDTRIEAAGLVHRVTAPLVEAGLHVTSWLGGEAEPSLDVVDRSIEAAREAKPDVVLGLGGGSNMDLAKITALVLSHGGAPRDYFGEDRVPGPVLPIICVPTTSGTGSEVSAATVLTDRQNALKVGVLSNYLRPRVAIVDPQLTLGCPAQVTADSGIDALTHAIEAYTAIDNATFPYPSGEVTLYQGRHPLGDCLAERAIQLVGQHLRRAVHHPDDLAAREGMSLAAMLAGMSFSNVGVALVHALEYPVGGASHCSHGAGNGLLLPYVMRFNMPGREAEFGRVAALLGENVTGLDDRAAAEAAIVAVEKLKRDIGIPERLRELRLTHDQLPGLAKAASGITRILRVNPRPVTAADCEAILQTAW